MSLFEAIEAIRDSGTITENSLCAELSKTEDIPFVQLSELTFDPQIEDRPKLKSLLDDRLIPIYESPSELGIATDSPYHPCLTTLSKTFEKPVQPYLINRPECNVYLSRKKQGRSAQDLTVLDTIFQMAVDRGASDIHVFQKARSADISLRIQGDLIPSFSISGDENSRLVSLLKYHSHMDISICNKPQDGRLTHQINNKDYDIRVATLPTTFGEDFACRIFGGQPARTLETLGLSKAALLLCHDLLDHPSGLVLVTGPTGSGKTTTLYAALQSIQRKKNKTIVSLEDPVERILPGIRQSQINPSIGYTFSSGLKAVLRQDPDVILIGEIRDAETARIALDAAYTGHLVLCSLHTDTCQSTLLRLLSFGLDPFLINQSLRGVVSQRLEAKPCTACNDRTNGCGACHLTGISGRGPTCEILTICDSAEPLKSEADVGRFLKDNKHHSWGEDQRSHQNKPPQGLSDNTHVF